jgi:hypothetical protein
MHGGKDCYLCPEDAAIFGAIITRAASQLNCIGTNKALRLAFQLLEDRRAMAAAILDAIGSGQLGDQVREKRISVPDPMWLKGFAAELNI